MSAVDDSLKTEVLRLTLARFWAEALEVQSTSRGVTLAVPQTGADGWQLVVEIGPVSPSSARISDGGRVLGDLVGTGQNCDGPQFAAHLDTLLRPAAVQRDGLELFRWLRLPLDPVDLHVFVEALVGVSHLRVLHEPRIRHQDAVDETVERILNDRQIKAKRSAKLDGRTERDVRIDYLTETRKPVGIQILRRRNGVFNTMERWGFRWMDLKRVHPTLVPVMLYDRATVKVDERSQAIGDDVCELFCPHDETDRIHEVLATAMD